VKVLLERGDVHSNNRDKHGKTPLDWATDNGHQEVIVLLQPPGSPPPAFPTVGEAPALHSLQMRIPVSCTIPAQCSQRARPMVGRPIGRRPG